MALLPIVKRNIVTEEKMAAHLSLHQLLLLSLILFKLQSMSQQEEETLVTFVYTPQKYHGITERECPRTEEQLMTFLHEINTTSYMENILNFITDRVDGLLDTTSTVAIDSDQLQLVTTHDGMETSATYTPLSSTVAIPTCPGNEEQLRNLLHENFPDNRDQIVSILLRNSDSDIVTTTMSPESTHDQTQTSVDVTTNSESLSTVQTTEAVATTDPQNQSTQAATTITPSCSTSPPPLALSTIESYLGPHNFRENFNHTCNIANGEALSQVGGSHDGNSEDRRYDIYCRQVAPGPLTNCIWSGFVNELDFPLFFQCQPNFVMAGVYSIFDNMGFDRRFDLLCCDYAELCTRNCGLSEYANDFDQGMRFTVPPGTAIIGAYSFHRDFYEDRRWRFSTCDYMYCS